MLLSLNSAYAAPWGQDLLHDINLQLGPGQILGVLGPNGAGKTSLLNLLCGSTSLSRGAYLFGDRPMYEWPILQRARAQAVLPQHSSLNFPYTVEEVVLLGRTPHESGSAIDAQVVNAVLDATDTQSLRERLYTQLSGGEKQRVQLARVFAQVWRTQDAAQRLLLLDEPTSADQGCAVVIIVHDFNLAARYTDLCLVLQDGRQRALGTPTQIFTPDMFREVFAVDVTVSKHPKLDIPLVIQ